MDFFAGGYWCCTHPRLSDTSSVSTRPHHHHYYYQVIEWSHSALPLGWTSSPRIWGEVINVVNCALKRPGIRTLLYVDDLLVAVAPKKNPSQRARSSPRRSKMTGLQNFRRKASGHLSKSYKITIIDSKGGGRLQLPERHCVMIRRVSRHLLYQASQNRRLI